MHPPVSAGLHRIRVARPNGDPSGIAGGACLRVGRVGKRDRHPSRNLAVSGGVFPSPPSLDRVISTPPIFSGVLSSSDLTMPGQSPLPVNSVVKGWRQMTAFATDDTMLVRPRHRLLRILVCVAILAGLSAWGLIAVAGDLDNGLKAVGGAAVKVLLQSGAYNAARVSNVAHTEGIAMSAVTVAQTQQLYPTERWLPGSVAITGMNDVSMKVTGDHVVTVSEISGSGPPCSYGLAVWSAEDPVIAADGLPGVGVYATVGQGSPCEADLAPTSQWVKVSSSDLRDAGVSVTPIR